MCSFGSCQTRFEFLSQFRKVRNAFECFVTQVQTQLPKTKRVWPLEDKRDLYCMYHVSSNNSFILTHTLLGAATAHRTSMDIQYVIINLKAVRTIIFVIAFFSHVANMYTC